MSYELNNIMRDGVALDLEINPSDNSLLKIGAIDLFTEDRSLCFKGKFGSAALDQAPVSINSCFTRFSSSNTLPATWLRFL